MLLSSVLLVIFAEIYQQAMNVHRDSNVEKVSMQGRF